MSITVLYSGEVDEEEKEREHSSMQDQLDKELQELDKRLQQKEVLFSCLNYCGFSKLFIYLLYQHLVSSVLHLRYIVF